MAKHIPAPYDYGIGNYAAPTKAWDATARTQFPSAAQLADGATPDTPIPAELVNGLERLHSDAAAVQAHGALQFSREDMVVGTATISKLSAVQLQSGIGAPANRQKSILVSGASAGSLALVSLLNDGTNPPAVFSTLAGSPPNSAPASDGSGVIFVGLGGGGAAKTTDGGATASAVIVTGAVNVNWVGFTTAHYLAFESSTNKIYQATALGGVWTGTALGGPLDIVYDLMTNGAGLWVMLGSAVGGVTYAWRSTDDGVTWASASLAYAPGGASGAWSDAWQRFVVVDSLGKLWTSTDAITWTLIKTVAALDVSSMATNYGQNTVVCCGHAVVCVANRPINSLGKYANGVAYTFDLGATWNEVYLGSVTNKPITQILAANGRVYATDGASLYQSNLLETPPVLFTGA